MQIEYKSKICKEFIATITLFTSEEGGKNEPIYPYYKLHFVMNNKKYVGIIMNMSCNMLFPGQTAIINVQLNQNALIYESMEIEIQGSHATKIARAKIVSYTL